MKKKREGRGWGCKKGVGERKEERSVYGKGWVFRQCSSPFFFNDCKNGNSEWLPFPLSLSLCGPKSYWQFAVSLAGSAPCVPQRKFFRKVPQKFNALSIEKSLLAALPLLAHFCRTIVYIFALVFFFWHILRMEAAGFATLRETHTQTSSLLLLN